LSDLAELEQFADPYPVGNLRAAPSAVVSPADVEQVQAIVRFFPVAIGDSGIPY
jgi:4-cresol dehydrogenase (hydroxylating)